MTKVLIMGATGFIGRNLLIKLYKSPEYEITGFSRHANTLRNMYPKAKFIEGIYDANFDFDCMVKGQDCVFHLISTTYPATSNENIQKEISDNIVAAVNFLESCIRNKVKKVIFISSGGTVYGKTFKVPIKENTVTNPINSYGIQKLTIEKLLYLYNYIHKLDYRVIRLANPYGPYQRVHSGLGVISIFINKAINNDPIQVFGDGNVIRDYIYIDDVIEGIVNITKYSGSERIFNLGSGKGTSINEVIDEIEHVLNRRLKVKHVPGRAVDVPVNILDMSLYNDEIDEISYTPMDLGIRKTIDFQLNHKDGING